MRYLILCCLVFALGCHCYHEPKPEVIVVPQPHQCPPPVVVQPPVYRQPPPRPWFEIYIGPQPPYCPPPHHHHHHNPHHR